MLFNSSTFIKDYSSTDKFITIQYPNETRYSVINVCQHNKSMLNKDKIKIYQEGSSVIIVQFISEPDLRNLHKTVNNS